MEDIQLFKLNQDNTMINDNIELVEFILWQRYCYEMENDYWAYNREKCSKCGSSELYLKEVPNVDFADNVICKMCGTEFIRK